MRYLWVVGALLMELGFSPLVQSQAVDSSSGIQPFLQRSEINETQKAAARFEVVSIRESGRDSEISFNVSPDSVTAKRQNVISLILVAYFPPSVWSPDRIRNCPASLCLQDYDLRAKVPEELQARWRSPEHNALGKEMIKKLLADRFKLSLHSIPAEMPGFAIVMGRKGAKLRPTPKDEVLPKSGIVLSNGGIAVHSGEGKNAAYDFYGASMTSLVDFLTPGSHSLIEDRTGLADRYDFTLSVNPDAPLGSTGAVNNPDILWNLDALGLRVVETKLQTTILVVDHVERPTPN